jgi:hypothetical protein
MGADPGDTFCGIIFLLSGMIYHAFKCYAACFKMLQTFESAETGWYSQVEKFASEFLTRCLKFVDLRIPGTVGSGI